MAKATVGAAPSSGTANPAGSAKTAGSPASDQGDAKSARPSGEAHGPKGREDDETPRSSAEAASAQGHNVSYSSAHPENRWRRNKSSRADRSAKGRRGKGRKRRTADTSEPMDATSTAEASDATGSSDATGVLGESERADRSTEPPTAERLRRLREQLRPADWHTDDDNPYLQEDVEGPQDEYWYEDEQVSPVVPVRDISPQKRRRTTSAARNRGVIAVLGVFAAMAALAFFVWITRSVTFTLNGNDATTVYGTSLADYVRQSDLEFTPGNLVSVSGNVLAEGGGDAYAATVDGEPKRPGEADDVHLTGGEVVELGNGLDVIEDHDTEIIEAPPKLEFDGDLGAFSFVSQWGTPGSQEQLTGKLSGEVALGDYTKEPTNTVVTRLSVTPSDNRKIVALTFDDGPSSYTPQYLDILAQYNAKATFFMFGPSAERDPDMVKRVVEAGHQICSHTSQHQDLSAMDAEQLQNELRTTFDQIDNASGLQTTVIRPPWSIWTNDCWLNSGGLTSGTVIYTADSRDWDQPGVDAIVDNALEGLAPGSIILMHDGGYPLDQDLQALPIIIQEIQAQGYELVTLSELLASDPSIVEAAATCDDPMPEGSVWPTEFAETE